MLRRHPRALYLLALVQVWERFACFATLPLLVLYLQQVHGLRADVAVLLFGALQALSYLSGLPGGLLADRWLGRRLATFLGTVLLTLGYGTLGLERPVWLGPALLLLVAGHGLFKPALHALVGGLYTDGDPRRDRGFLLMHIVFNAGAAVAPAVAEWARARWSWAAVFQVATLGMLASTVCIALSAAALGPSRAHAVPIVANARDADDEEDRTRACWQVCGLGVVFWVAAVQASTSLSLFAEQNTHLRVSGLGRVLTVAPGHFMSLHSLLVLVLAPPLSALLAWLHRRGQALSTLGKMVWGFVATSAAFGVMSLAGLQGGDAGRVGLGWLGGCYVLLTLAELLLAPMGMALVTRLAPRHKTSRRVALWFAATAAGNGLAGLLGFVWTRCPHHRYFAALALLALGAAALLLRWMESLEAILQQAPKEACSAPTRREPGPVPGLSMEPSGRGRLLAASLAIAGPVPLLASVQLPLGVRAVSAIVCGLAVLGGGPYLVAQAIDGRLRCKREPSP